MSLLSLSRARELSQDVPTVVSFCIKASRSAKKHNQLFTSAQHLLLLILGLHVSTDHSVIFRSLVCYKFQHSALKLVTY